MTTLHHPHHAPHPSSDLDSDNPTTTYPIPQPIPPNHLRTNSALNHAVLRRHLPTTTSIDLIVPYAVVYAFHRTPNSWEKLGIEGSLFVVRTQTEEQKQQDERYRESGEGDVGEIGRGGYSIVVLNRRGLENFVVGLRRRGEVEVSGDIIIVRDGEGRDREGEDGGEKIFGLWIFDEEGGSTEGMRKWVGEVIMERAGRVEEWEGEWEDEDEEGEGEGEWQEWVVKEIDGKPPLEALRLPGMLAKGAPAKGADSPDSGEWEDADEEEGNGETDGKGVVDATQQQDAPVKGDNSPDLMALLNGHRREPAENITAPEVIPQQGLAPEQANLLDLFKKG
ncbi:hypothetical protein ACLMJK_009223 [Lecanora helva]